MARITFASIPTAKLFVDGVEEKIFVGDVRQPHGKEGAGYQRRPTRRNKWMDRKYDQALMRVIEVSPRPDGMYAIVDGGGRWTLAQNAKKTEMHCRVHHGLSREDEAILFEEFDTEIYRLRGIDRFLAQLGAGNEIALAIEEAVRPYGIAVSGKGTLKCVGQLVTVKCGSPYGVKLLSSVAKILAPAYSAYNSKTKEFEKGGVIDGYLVIAYAIILDSVLEAIAEDKADVGQYAAWEKRLAFIASRTSPEKIKSHFTKDGAPFPKSIPAGALVAHYLVNRPVTAGTGKDLVPVEYKPSKFHLEANRVNVDYASGQTFSSRIREQKGDDIAEAA